MVSARRRGRTDPDWHLHRTPDPPGVSTTTRSHQVKRVDDRTPPADRSPATPDRRAAARLGPRRRQGIAAPERRPSRRPSLTARDRPPYLSGIHLLRPLPHREDP